jgi:ATP-dependent Clp protease protease subunit
MYQSDLETGEIFLYDAIGSSFWGMIDAATVLPDLARMAGRKVTLRISSPGGSVDEGRAIFNALKRHQGGVDVVVDSSAYSIASYIAMAGDRVVMAKNAMMMVHNPWTMAMGSAAELRKTADVLDKYRDSILDAYMDRTKKDRKKIMAILDAETWYTANEAVSAGFATEVGDIIVDAPSFAKAMYGGKPEGEKLNQPAAGSRTPWPVMNERLRQNGKVKAQRGKLTTKGEQHT